MSNFIYRVSPRLAVEDVDPAVAVRIDTVDPDGTERKRGCGAQREVTAAIAVEVHSSFRIAEGPPLACPELCSVACRFSGRNGVAVQGNVEADVIALG